MADVQGAFSQSNRLSLKQLNMLRREAALEPIRELPVVSSSSYKDDAHVDIEEWARHLRATFHCSSDTDYAAEIKPPWTYASVGGTFDR